MLHNKLIAPKTIAVIGGSNDVHKQGGKLVSNLKQSLFNGSIYIVNPKELNVQGLQCFQSVFDLPQTDLAILAIPAVLCYESIEILV